MLSHRGRGRPSTPALSLNSEGAGAPASLLLGLAAPPRHFLQMRRQLWAHGRAHESTRL